jgi:metallo-beta-lactamase family protein
MAAAKSAKTLDHALSDSGIVYIPAFALGRTQELIYELDRINPGIKVFIDSPSGIRITRLYQDMDQCWDKEAKALKAAGDHPIHAGTPESAIFLLLTKHLPPVMSNNIEHNR